MYRTWTVATAIPETYHAAPTSHIRVPLDRRTPRALSRPPLQQEVPLEPECDPNQREDDEEHNPGCGRWTTPARHMRRAGHGGRFAARIEQHGHGPQVGLEHRR